MATSKKKAEKRTYGKSYSYEEYVKYFRPESVREEEQEDEHIQPSRERRRQELNKQDRKNDPPCHC